jgi:guanylate kinase
MTNKKPVFSPYLFCLCGPSGVGKSTISRALLENDSKLLPSVSATTRAPRQGEQEGVHYHFISKENFEADVQRGRFLEWASYNDNLYGTPISNIEEAEKQESDLLLDIDVQGAQKLKIALRNRVVVIFVKPPSFDALKSRLVGRGSETPEAIEKRLKRAGEEFSILDSDGLTDFTVINEGLEQAIAGVAAIISQVRSRIK